MRNQISLSLSIPEPFRLGQNCVVRLVILRLTTNVFKKDISNYYNGAAV